MNKVNFHYVIILLDLLYGISMETEDVEELGLLAWELIGNKDTRLYQYSSCLDAENSITLPCNASSVEAVTTNLEDWSRVTNYSEEGDPHTAFIENSIEVGKIYKSPYYLSGKLLSYTLVGDTLYFPINYGTVNILYKGILLDDEGLPQLTDKEALAITTYLAYITKYKEGLQTNNSALLQLALLLELKWLKQCDQARVTKLSLNDLNDILNVKDSWGRHSYGFSYKPIHK